MCGLLILNTTGQGVCLKFCNKRTEFRYFFNFQLQTVTTLKLEAQKMAVVTGENLNSFREEDCIYFLLYSGSLKSTLRRFEKKTQLLGEIS